MRIFSVYNPPSSDSTISLLSSILSSLPTLDLLLIGDFNKHDALWSGPLHPERTARSDSTLLLTLLADHGLRLCLAPGTPTFLSDAHGTWSTLDLVFCSEDLEDLLTACSTDIGHGSDHFAVRASFDLDTERREAEPRPQYRACDWIAFQETVRAALAADPVPMVLKTRADIDNAVKHVQHIVIAALNKHVPVSRKSPYSKRWWTKELSNLRLVVNQAQRAAQKNPTPARVAIMKAMRNKYHARIEKTKRQHWRDWVEAADEQSVWTANKYVANPSSSNSARVPELHDPAGKVASSNAEKCEMLRRTFFPDAPPVDLQDVSEQTGHAQLPDIVILEEAIRQCIRELSP